MSSRYTEKKPENVARGLKAAMHNQNVSSEAKESAAERLHSMGEEVPGQKDESPGNRVLGGHKAALKNPHVSEEAKHHSEQVLKEAYD